LTAPAATPPGADPKAQADPKAPNPKVSRRRRLLAGLFLIAAALVTLVVVERFREGPAPPPAPHEPSQALIVPPSAPSAPVEPAPAEPVATPEPESQPAAPPPPPVVVNDAGTPAASPGRPAPAEPAPPRPEALAGGAFVVQAGVFASPDNAHQLQQRLAREGLRAKMETRVQLGPFKDKQEADQALAKLKKLGVNAIVVPVR
jgi:DedD protein